MKKFVQLLNLIFLLVGYISLAQEVQTNEYRQPEFIPNNPFIHDPVMAKDGDTYYLFGTGIGISVMSSKDLKVWKEEPSIFKEAPEWTKEALPGFGNHIWAPDIIYYKGNYHLFYSCNALPGKPHAAIGHATTPTLNPESPDFKWTDHGKIVQSIMGRDYWQAIDANAIVDENGDPWLAFGSFWDGIKLVRLTNDMSALKWPQEWHSLARRPTAQKPFEYELTDSQIEAAFIYKHEDYYYLFVSLDMCCRGTKSDYKLAVGRSKSIKGPYLNEVGFDMIDGNSTVIAIGDGKKFAALGHNSVYKVDGKELMFAHGYSIPDNGDSKLIVVELEWDENGWPVIDLDKRISY